MFGCDFFFKGTILCEIMWAKKCFCSYKKKSSHSVNCTCSLSEFIFFWENKIRNKPCPSFPVNPRMEDMLISIAALIISLKSLHLIICTNKWGQEGERDKQKDRDRKREREGSREGREKTIGWARCFLFP